MCVDSVVRKERHLVKNNSNSERGNPLPPLHGLVFAIGRKQDLVHAPSHRQNNIIPLPLLYKSWSTGWNAIMS